MRPPPRLGDLAHDLRNLIGLSRAMAVELPALLAGAAPAAHDVAADLGTQTRFALDALRVIEKWDDPAPTEIHLGAWCWALRLSARGLLLDDLAEATRAPLVVPAALDAGAALLAAFGAGRTVRVRLLEHGGGVAFERAVGGVDRAALDRALAALVATGLRASVVSETPFSVAVTPA